MARRRSNYLPLQQHNHQDPNPNWRSRGSYDVRPGLCVIINNMIFIKAENLSQRQRDEDNLRELFSTLLFDVRVHQNLTAQKMTSQLESYSKMQHTGVFFLVILSHGALSDNREAVLGTDDVSVPIHQLERLFHASNCRSLHEVPKIFLIDACRGNVREMAYSISGARTLSANNIAQPARAEPVTDSMHFMIIFASTHGNVAYTTNDGSHLTQTFVTVMNEAGPDTPFKLIIQEVRDRVQTFADHQTVETVERLTRDYFIKRYAHMQGLQNQLHTLIDQWIPVRRSIIQEIQTTIANLQVHHKNVNISRIFGSTTSIAGSLIAILGFGLAPVTFGASVGLSVGGIALAVAGGGTAAGASIADIFIQKFNVNHAQEQLRRDYDQFYEIREVAEEIQTRYQIEADQQQFQGVSNTEAAAVSGEALGQGFIRASNVGLRVAEVAAFSTLDIGAAALRTGGAAIRGVAAVGIVLNVVLIPIDLIEIIRSSVSLAKGSQTRAIRRLNEAVQQLEEQLETVRQIRNEQ